MGQVGCGKHETKQVRRDVMRMLFAAGVYLLLLALIVLFNHGAHK